MSQVAPTFGSRIGHKGALVAGMCALAVGSALDAQAQGLRDQPTAAQTRTSAPAQESAPWWAPVSARDFAEGLPLATNTQAQQAQPMSEQASRNVGRAVGGVIGLAVGHATQAGSTMKALLTVGGILVGDQVAKTSHESQQAQTGPQSAQTEIAHGKVDPAVLGALKLTEDGRARPAAVGRPIPADFLQNMTTLVLDAAAHRLLAQESWREASQAAVNASLRPHDTSAAQASGAASARFKEVMRRNNESFYWFRNAVGTLQSNGFNVEPYLALNRVLSQNVDHKGIVQLDHPLIRTRAEEVLGRFAPGKVELVNLQAQEARRVAVDTVQR